MSKSPVFRPDGLSTAPDNLPQLATSFQSLQFLAQTSLTFVSTTLLQLPGTLNIVTCSFFQSTLCDCQYHFNHMVTTQCTTFMLATFPPTTRVPCPNYMPTPCILAVIVSIFLITCTCTTFMLATLQPAPWVALPQLPAYPTCAL